MDPRDIHCGYNLPSLPAGHAGTGPGYYAGGMARIDWYIKNPTTPNVMQDREVTSLHGNLVSVPEGPITIYSLQITD